MKWIYKLNRWFDLNYGWFFVNGYKREDWNKELKQKYGKNERDIHTDA